MPRSDVEITFSAGAPIFASIQGAQSQAQSSAVSVGGTVGNVDVDITGVAASATGGLATGEAGDTTLSLDYPVSPYGWSGLTDIKFTVRIPAVQGSDKSFTYTTLDSGTGSAYAEAGTDYTAVSGTGTITAGSLYTQISVPIAGNAPPLGRHEFQFQVTDIDTTAVITSTGLIVDALYYYDNDYPDGQVLKRRIQKDSNDAVYNDERMTLRTATTLTDTTQSAGIQSVEHDLFNPTGDQVLPGFETIGATHIGTVFDGLEYYWKWDMRIESGFIYDGNVQDKFKFGRITTPEGIPNYSTFYLHAESIRMTKSYPGAGNEQVVLLFDFLNQDDQWHEYIWYFKKESSPTTANGIARFIVDGVVVDEILNMHYVDTNFTIPSGDPEMQFSGHVMPGFTQNQAGTATGGSLWFDQLWGTQGTWPSAKYPKPF